MKLVSCLVIFVFLSAFYVSDNNQAFKKLYALEGLWKMQGRRGIICEEWKKMSDSYLQNKGFAISGTDTIITERVALTNNSEGILYTSTVEDQNNKQPISFKMTRCKGNSFTFENALHDYPKRIVYSFVTADSLHAFIDDGIDGSKKRQDFYYKRQ